MDALTQTALTLGMSLISLAAGKALARVLPAQYILDFFRLLSCRRTRQHGSNIRSQHDGEESLPKTAQDGGVTVTTAVGPPKHQPGRSDPRDALSFDIFSLFLGLAFWAGAGLLCGLYAPFRRVTFALVFGPPGTFLRWYLSRLNTAPASKRAPYWPLGTLAANLLATAVIASLFTSQYVGRISGAGARGAHTVIGCEALYGLQEGFCGCLSTISTFAVELRNTKPRRRAMGYALGSWVCGVGICVLLVGAPWWSLGMDGSCKGVL